MPSMPHDVSGLVAVAAVETPDRVALAESTGRSLTWRALEDEVSRVSTGLGDVGVVAGHRVMVVLGNRIEFVTTYLGVLRAQAVAVPANPRATVDELTRMIDDSGSRVVVAEPGTVDAVRAAADAAVQRPRLVVVGPAAAGTGGDADETSYADLVDVAPRPLPPLEDPERLAALLYTSGSSGRPRAAMLTHRALMANIGQVAAVGPPLVHGDDVVLGVLPLFHVYGLNAVLGGVLRHRARLVLVEQWDPQAVLDLVEDEACSVLPVAPPVLVRWLPVEDLAERLGPVRLVVSGAAPLDGEVVERFTERGRVPVHQGYGLTEAAPIVTTTLHSDTARPGSVGAALPGVEVRLVDPTGRPVAGGDPGEISLRGDNLFSGYWPDGADGPDAEGWWATGDVGFLDADGDLTLVDRLRDVVIVSGFNVYPTEVEDVLREVPGVADVAVVGTPDGETGEAVVAYLVADHGHDHEALVDRVREHAAARLARFKLPTRVEVVPELPQTATGKVQKGRLRSRELRRTTGLLE